MTTAPNGQFPSFGTCTAFLRYDRILPDDASTAQFVPRVLDDTRSGHSQAPVEAIVHTHCHIDHTAGALAFLTEAEARGRPRPRTPAVRP